MRRRILGIGVLSAVFSLGIAEGGTIAASLFSPLAPPGSTPVTISLAGITGPSQSTVTGSGYSISFSNVGPIQGVVQGTLGPVGHGVPVAGVAGGSPEFLSGGFGSSVTSNIDASGNYLSTGLGTITIEFLTPQTSFALLWGSIDLGNSMSFNDASHFALSGADIQAAATGLVGFGVLGPGGSAYVIVNTETPFTTVTATSSNISFEFVPFAASTTPFEDPSPEPESVALMTGGILLLLAHRWRKAKRAA